MTIVVCGTLRVNLDFEENSPFQESIISETIQRLDKSFFHNPKELEDFIDKRNLIHRFLPKQTDIDKILQIIQRKVFKGTHLPVEIKEIQAGYLCSPYFKDIYQYLLQNKLLSSKLAIKKLEALSKNMYCQILYCSEFIQKRTQQFWQYQKCVQTR